MKRTTVLKSAAVLGVASLALAACGGSSESSESSAAPAESSAAASAAASEAPASEAAASTGVPLYLVDGNTGNALGEKLPAGTLNGVKGTIPRCREH